MPAGWYADPRSPSDTVRYWNGTSWTHHCQPMPDLQQTPNSDSDSVPTSGDDAQRRPSPVGAAWRTCPACAKAMSPAAHFCDGCGRPMDPNASSSQQPGRSLDPRTSTSETKVMGRTSAGSRVGWWTAGIAAALALVLGMGWAISANRAATDWPAADSGTTKQEEMIEVDFSLEIGGACSRVSGPYTEIHAGSNVLVSSGAGAILGKGVLDEEEIRRENASPAMRCIYTSTFTIPTDPQGIYQVGLENSEGSLTYDQSDVVNGVLTVNTVIG